MTVYAGNIILASDINAFIPSSAIVATSETSVSVAYADIATVGPTVSKLTGTNALVIVSCFLFNSGAGNVSSMSFTVSGATTLSAVDAQALQLHSTIANGQGSYSRAYHLTGLTAGVNVFTAKYKVNAGTGTFSARQLIVT